MDATDWIVCERGLCCAGGQMGWVTRGLALWESSEWTGRFFDQSLSCGGIWRGGL